MAFAISKEKIGSDHQDSVETESGNRVISSQLYLKSSSHENLDKNVVLRRLRHHKCLQQNVINQDSENGSSLISSQLYLKSSIDHQNVVLRRLRHHNCKFAKSIGQYFFHKEL
ncbi:hypothetical protein H5410_009252 [Solanum commersonii]|uniref:Uncharacterized protein n=1 Tax=Solanum commersonii TaxID=4109 RepID=A0A9J6AIZ9_SOLCO|nr:hypothetical protein H5410_009252 [Solanum commersonii]